MVLITQNQKSVNMLIKKSAGKGHFVYFTEEPDLARQKAQSGFAVVGICYPGPEKQDWSGISYILELENVEELEELEDWYVQEVWCRYYKESISIGTFSIEQLGIHFCLREMRIEDVEKLYTLYEDDAIKLWITPLDSNLSVEKEKAKSYIKNVYEMCGCGIWIVEAMETGEIVGRVGIEPCEGEEGLFLGYMIKDTMRGNHIAEEACKLSLDYVKKRLEPKEVLCKIDEENVPSIKLAEKLGFVFSEKKDGVNYYFLSLLNYSQKFS